MAPPPSFCNSQARSPSVPPLVLSLPVVVLPAALEVLALPALALRLPSSNTRLHKPVSESKDLDSVSLGDQCSVYLGLHHSQYLLSRHTT